MTPYDPEDVARRLKQRREALQKVILEVVEAWPECIRVIVSEVLDLGQLDNQQRWLLVQKIETWQKPIDDWQNCEVATYRSHLQDMFRDALARFPDKRECYAELKIVLLPPGRYSYEYFARIASLYPGSAEKRGYFFTFLDDASIEDIHPMLYFAREPIGSDSWTAFRRGVLGDSEWARKYGHWTLVGELLAIFAGELEWRPVGDFGFLQFARGTLLSEKSIEVAIARVMKCHKEKTESKTNHVISKVSADALGRLFGAACGSDFWRAPLISLPNNWQSCSRCIARLPLPGSRKSRATILFALSCALDCATAPGPKTSLRSNSFLKSWFCAAMFSIWRDSGTRWRRLGSTKSSFRRWT
jgi:hypothetical protein